jgi:hypothetical protein
MTDAGETLPAETLDNGDTVPVAAEAGAAEADGAQCAEEETTDEQPAGESLDEQGEEQKDSGQAGMTTEEGTGEPQGETTAALDETSEAEEETAEPQGETTAALDETSEAEEGAAEPEPGADGQEEQKDSGQAGMTEESAERPAGWDTMARVNPAFRARG